LEETLEKEQGEKTIRRKAQTRTTSQAARRKQSTKNPKSKEEKIKNGPFSGEKFIDG
jgi:hypothetical protein